MANFARWSALVLMASAAPMAAAMAQSPPPAGLAGDWSGTLPNVPPKKLVIHIRRTDQGMRLTIDVPALGVQGIPIDQFGREGAKVHFAMPAARVAFEGELQPDGREIRGTFTDHDIVQPLVLDYTASDAPPPPLKVASAQAGWKTPSPEDIRQILKSEIAARHAVGLVVGVVGPGGRVVVSEGAADLKTGASIGAETPLYMESVVKALTGLLLADMAGRGELKLDDPVDLYLPRGEHMPELHGRRITLADLATHTSGLPRGVEGVSFEAQIRYRPEQIRRYLESFQLARDPGSAYQYSDIGTALLGDALARRAGASFDQLLRTRIIGPYGLGETVTHTNPALTARLPMQYDSGLQPRGRGPDFDDTWLPAFGLYSTVDDMLKLLEVQLGYRPDPMAAASRRARDLAARPRPAPPRRPRRGAVAVLGSAPTRPAGHGGLRRAGRLAQHGDLCGLPPRHARGRGGLRQHAPERLRHRPLRADRPPRAAPRGPERIRDPGRDPCARRGPGRLRRPLSPEPADGPEHHRPGRAAVRGGQRQSADRGLWLQPHPLLRPYGQRPARFPARSGRPRRRPDLHPEWGRHARRPPGQPGRLTSRRAGGAIGLQL
jgi:CubicO group peptidase (beta-lactamase class C family)